MTTTPLADLEARLADVEKAISVAKGFAECQIGARRAHFAISFEVNYQTETSGALDLLVAKLFIDEAPERMRQAIGALEAERRSIREEIVVTAARIAGGK